MALVQTMTKYSLAILAREYNRLNDMGGFRGWEALGEYLEELSEDIGENIEADIVALCCEYEHHKDVEGFYSEYGWDIVDSEEWVELDDSEKLKLVSEYLTDNTSVACCESDCIIFAKF